MTARLLALIGIAAVAAAPTGSSAWARSPEVAGDRISSAVSQQQPVFRSRADLVLVEAQVVDGTGEPVPDLTRDDFDVRIDGNRRNVSWVQFVRDRGPVAGGTGAGVLPAASYSTGRRYIVAIDESSFTSGALLAWKEAVRRFVRGLEPADYVALYAYPVGGPLEQLTRNHAAVIDAVDKAVGLLDLPQWRYRLSVGEVVDITAGDEEVINRVARRECPREDRCAKEITELAFLFAQMFETRTTQSVAGLRALMRSLRDLEGRKTVVVVSGGLVLGDRPFGRIDLSQIVFDLGREAAQANVNLYVLHLDSSFIEAFGVRGVAHAQMMRESRTLAHGLDLFAGTAGGSLISVQAGTGDYAFERVLRETSAYYLLGVEPDSADRDGELHRIAVRVNASRAAVRHRNFVVIPKADR